MNRRGFLTTLLAGAVLDPERLLYVPGKRVISIPKPMLSVRLVRFHAMVSRDAVQRLDVVYGHHFLAHGKVANNISAREAGDMTDRVWSDEKSRAMARELIDRAVDQPGTFHAYQTLHRDGRKIGVALESPIPEPLLHTVHIAS